MEREQTEVETQYAHGAKEHAFTKAEHASVETQCSGKENQRAYKEAEQTDASLLLT